MERTAISAIPERRHTFRAAVAVALACATAAGCEGGRGPAGPPGPGAATPTDVARDEDAPELIVAITDLLGASGAGGAFRAGDRLTVRFTLEKEDGRPWLASELTGGAALVSGPTFNYQRVLPLAEDVLDAARSDGPGAFTYTFAARIPATFAPPYNDSPAFDDGDGERAGQPLLSGTYTVGLWFRWDFRVDGRPFQQIGEATADFLVGAGAGSLEPRDVTRQENCNLCHVDLRAHDGRYRSLPMCLLCHTSGAEDLNDPAIEGGTPGVSVDARVLFHKLHDGRYLPSVLGVATNPDGTRNYGATPRPYRLVGADGGVHDYSDTGWPVMPNRIQPMPQDVGYSALSPAEQALEDRMRGGVVSCRVCHGDPDGAGPLEAPSRGDQAYDQMTRRACGSCHDDVDFDLPYDAQNQIMPEQLDDSRCIVCHDSTFGGALASFDAHVHPLEDPTFDPGIVIDLLSVEEAGNNDSDGTLDPGEKLRLEFTVTDRAGLEVDASTLDSIRVIVSGPTTNLQTLLAVELPPSFLTGSQPYAGNVPERRFEFLGDATAAASEVFTTALTPHLTGPGIETSVFVRTSTGGGASVLASGAPRFQNFLDVLDATGFARGDMLVVDDGAAGEEYLRVLLVDGSRLWVSAREPGDPVAGAERTHPAGATVLEVGLTALTEGVDFSLDAASGEITELVEFGPGNAVLASYTTHFVMPAEYGTPLNASPDLGESAGEWTGKTLVDGTYLVSLSAYRDSTFFAMGQLTPYRSSSPAATKEFLVGSALNVEPYELISSGLNCNACHQDIAFHGGRDRGFDTCIGCHGAPGSEDLPRYAAASAPETPATTVNFRTMLHRIHRGSELSQAYAVVGEGPDPYPDNFRVKTYDTFAFPALPGRTTNCAKCHGSPPVGLLPSDRDHPSQQGVPVLAWGIACGSCHDSAAATAHIELQTSPSGLEACAICHGPGRSEDVALVHRAR